MTDPQLFRPITDRTHFVDVIQRLTLAPDDLGNDWGHLLTSEPVVDLGEHILDVFVLCRTTPDLFGTVTLDPRLEAFQGIGGYEESLHKAGVTTALVLRERRLFLAGRSRPLLEFFGPLDGPAQAVTMTILDRLGLEAELIVLEFNDLIGA